MQTRLRVLLLQDAPVMACICVHACPSAIVKGGSFKVRHDRITFDHQSIIQLIINFMLL